jgi:hypothetical protein
VVVCVLSLMSLVVAGCSSSGHASPALVTYSEGLVPGHTMPTWSSPGSPPPDAAWDGPHLMYIQAWGESGCPQVVASVKAHGASQLIVRTRTDNLSHSDMCADDLAADTSTIRVPAAIDATRPVTVTIDGAIVKLGPAQ